MKKTIYLPMPKNADRLSYVRGLLAMNRITGRRIANKVGVRGCSVSRLLHGTMKSHRIQEAIAGELGLSFEDVWGAPE